MKFLIVDDSPTMRRIVLNSLRRMGYTSFAEAANGHEAIEKLDGSVEFVITGGHMPVTSGIELVQALRAHDDWASIPFVMIATRSERDALATDAHDAVDNFVLKPFTLATFREGVERTLQNRQAT